jgi:hypothetical protein
VWSNWVTIQLIITTCQSSPGRQPLGSRGLFPSRYACRCLSLCSCILDTLRTIQGYTLLQRLLVITIPRCITSVVVHLYPTNTSKCKLRIIYIQSYPYDNMVSCSYSAGVNSRLLSSDTEERLDFRVRRRSRVGETLGEVDINP